MTKFSGILVIFALSIAGNTVFSAFLSDGVKLVHFEKDENDTGLFNFVYQLDDGEKFSGKTVNLVDEGENGVVIQLIFGPDDLVYWVDFTKNDLENQESFSKMVRLVQRNGDTITMKDEFIEYQLTLSTASMWAGPYQTTWDLKRICFTKTSDCQQTFNYTISGTNNSRKYNGTTYLEAEDPLVQIIHLEDGVQRNDFYQIVFTPEEFHSSCPFCREITKIISQEGVLGARPISNIDPNALKSLVG